MAYSSGSQLTVLHRPLVTGGFDNAWRHMWLLQLLEERRYTTSIELARPGMLSILQRTGQSSTTKCYLVSKAHSAKAEKPGYIGILY